MRYWLLFLGVLALAAPLAGETGYDAWLRYAPIDAVVRTRYDALPAHAVALGDSLVIKTAQAELIRGVRGMLGRTLRAEFGLPNESSIVLGTFAPLKPVVPASEFPGHLRTDGFVLKAVTLNGFPCLLIAAPNDRGVLYGVFALLSRIARHDSVINLNEVQEPYAPIRWVNQWDNLNGSIERGYAGRSIYFENGAVRADLARAADYARLLASVGISGCTINNVNADPRILESDFSLNWLALPRRFAHGESPFRFRSI